MIKSIALLGGTGFVARGIIAAANDRKDIKLCVSSRSPSKVLSFLKENNYQCEVISLEEVETRNFDIIINGAGVCDPLIIKENPELLFKSHEDVDALVMRNLKSYPMTLFLNISSGAIYGEDFSKPAPKETPYEVPKLLRDIKGSPLDMYAMTKLFFERKHRELSQFKIVDIRLFSLFHRHIDLDSHYFMSQLLLANKKKETFLTSTENLVKDYSHPQDLIEIGLLLSKKEGINQGFDLTSALPVKKSEILDFFVAKYHLDVKYEQMSFNGTKLNYYSESDDLQRLGFTPTGTSLECIAREMEFLTK
ncbi:MAG: nucleoside-diphosphate-sugar epimerase [Bacteriovoracaceae bacterium]